MKSFNSLKELMINNKLQELDQSSLTMVDEDGRTLLHHAMWSVSNLSSGKKLDPTIIYKLLDILDDKAFSVIMLPDKSNDTPLTRAVWWAPLEVILALIKRLGNQASSILAERDSNGWTMLHEAIQWRYSSPEIINAVLENLGDQAPEVAALPNKAGSTSLHISLGHSEAKPEVVSSLLKILGDKAATVLALPDNFGLTPLHLAAKKNASAEIVLTLLEILGSQAESVVSMPDQYNNTPLHYAVRYASPEVITALLQVLGDKTPQVDRLLSKEPSLDKYEEQEYEWSVLHHFAGRGSSRKEDLTILRSLLGKGFSPEHKDFYGRTVLDLAKEKDNYLVANYLKYFNKPLPSHIQMRDEDFVLVRIWSPKINNKDAHIISAIANRHSDTNVGHASMAIYKNGKIVAYISFWPMNTTLLKTPGENNTVAEDLAAENSLPEVYILYSLDIDKILSHYKALKTKNLDWRLYGVSRNIQAKDNNPETIVHSCSSLVYELLEVGGLFDHVLSGFDKVSGVRPITPLKVGELVQKARKHEDILYPETKSYSEDYLLCYKTQLMEAVREDTARLLRFLKNAPDLLWFYAKKYQAMGMEALIQALEVTFPSAQAFQFFDLVKGIDEKSEIFQDTNFLSILSEKIQKPKLQLMPLLTELGYVSVSTDNIEPTYDQTFIQHDEQCYRLFIRHFLETIMMLLKQKPELSWRDENGYNALHWAVINGSDKLVKFLVENFAENINDVVDYRMVEKDINSENSKVENYLPLTALDLAIMHQQSNIITTLKEAGCLTQQELEQTLEREAQQSSNPVILKSRSLAALILKNWKREKVVCSSDTLSENTKIKETQATVAIEARSN